MHRWCCMIFQFVFVWVFLIVCMPLVYLSGHVHHGFSPAHTSTSVLQYLALVIHCWVFLTEPLPLKQFTILIFAVCGVEECQGLTCWSVNILSDNFDLVKHLQKELASADLLILCWPMTSCCNMGEQQCHSTLHVSRWFRIHLAEKLHTSSVSLRNRANQIMVSSELHALKKLMYCKQV